MNTEWIKDIIIIINGLWYDIDKPFKPRKDELFVSKINEKLILKDIMRMQ